MLSFFFTMQSYYYMVQLDSANITTSLFKYNNFNVVVQDLKFLSVLFINFKRGLQQVTDRHGENDRKGVALKFASNKPRKTTFIIKKKKVKQAWVIKQ